MNLKTILKLSIIKTIFYNHFSRKVIRGKKSYIYVYKNTCIKIGNHSKIILSNGAKLLVGSNPGIDGKMQTNLIISNGGRFFNSGETKLHSGSAIIIIGGELKTDSNTFNCHCCVKCHYRINIGSNSIFARGTQVLDSDFHLFSVNSKINRMDNEIVIGEKVWVGTNSVILKGSIIGSNCIIGACSLVSNNINSNCVFYNKRNETFIEKLDWWK